MIIYNICYERYLCFYCRKSYYICYRMYAFILQKKKFCCCCLYNSIKVLEFCRKSWKSPGTLMQKCEKSPRKSWNLNQFFRWEQRLSKSPLMQNSLHIHGLQRNGVYIHTLEISICINSLKLQLRVVIAIDNAEDTA